MNQRMIAAALVLLLLAALCGAALAQEGTADAPLAVVNGVSVPASQYVQEYQAYTFMYTDAQGSEDSLAAIREQMAQQAADAELTRQMAAALGADQLTEAELAELAAEADTQYEAMITFYLDYFAEEGLTDEEVRARTEEYFAGEGYTREGILESAREQAVLDKLYQIVTKDVLVTDEDLDAYYQARVAADQAQFEEELYNFEFALFGEGVVTYVPAGFRAVKSLLIRFEPEDVTRMYELTAQRAELQAVLGEHPDDVQAKADLATVQGAIDAIADKVMPGVREIQDKLNAGAQFDRLMAAYNEDAQIEMKPFSETGYYVRENSLLWPEEYTAAALALTEPGEVSDPVITPNGVYLIEYLGEVPAGPVPLADIRERLLREAMDDGKARAYEAALENWREGAQIELYPDSLK